MVSNFTIRVAQPDIREEDAQAMYNAVKKGYLSSGPMVEKFENAFAEYVGSKHAIAVNSGTAALQLALECLEIKNGDEVITTPFTFGATSNVIVLQNAKPVFVDIEKDTYNLDPKLVRKAITSKTKAIMPIHYAGQCCEMDELNEIAEENGIHVIEDAAPALGATYKGEKAGTLGKIAGFSFFPDKNMTTGEGGMITTDDHDIAEKCRILRKNGASKRYYNIYIGWNFKMPDPNAALGFSQLKRIETIIELKNKVAKYYSERLGSLEGITPLTIKEYNRCTFMLYVISTRDNIQREKIRLGLEKEGIETRINFPSMHLQPIYKELFGFSEGMLPNSESMSERILGLPIFINMTQEQQDRVMETIEKVIRE